MDGDEHKKATVEFDADELRDVIHACEMYRFGCTDGVHLHNWTNTIRKMKEALAVAQTA